MKKLLLFLLTIFLLSCGSNINSSNQLLNISDLPTGKFVKKSGRKLISQDNGLIKIESDSTFADSTIIIAVHGYQSEGYEWINALNDLSENYSNIYFYRYDWDTCPDIVGERLAKSIDSLLLSNPTISIINIYGHSYGGLVVTYCASFLNETINTEIHTIASPLAGYPRIMDNCDLIYSDDNKLEYPKWTSNIEHYQWRTQKEQDGAYRDLEFDPQEIELNNSTVITLPDSMDGHRLGHNWSVSWVIKYILDN
jgi:pimeloyl-ACP methyl ester carboxylesterase